MLAQPVAAPVLIYRFVHDIFPLVKRELSTWRSKAASIPQGELAAAALASIDSKAFHCIGGSIYALYPGVNIEQAVQFIVAYQTISDYLDNLVDSVGVCEEAAFAQLHLAMVDALEPDGLLSSYYEHYPFRDDGGYLAELVRTCQDNLSRVSALKLVQADMVSLASLYSSLQTFKHLGVPEREHKMLDWLEAYRQPFPQVSPWEFAAATGSTLGIFCLYALAFDHELDSQRVGTAVQAYFPWVTGLHILLDYLIDLDEDRATAQLNFVSYYDEPAAMAEGLVKFYCRAERALNALPHASFHRAVVHGLLAMYLSDSKTRNPVVARASRKLLQEAGLAAVLLRWVCCRLREARVL